MRSPVIVVIVSGGARGVGFHLKERLRRGCGTAIPHRLTSDGKVVGVDVGHDRVRRVPSVPLTRHVVDVSCDVGLANLVEEEIAASLSDKMPPTDIIDRTINCR